MRLGRALVGGLLAGLLAGCATNKPIQPTTLWERMRPSYGPTGPDVLQMDVALIERSLDDPYINGELWQLADEQVVALERKAILEENGFRVGVVRGIPPAGLQTLLTSKRSCANPRHFYLRAGKAEQLVLGPALSVCRFQVQQDSQPAPICVEQALCNLRVVPTAESDGRMHLQFTPLVRYGETRLLPHAAEDDSGFVLGTEQPTLVYPDLAWEVILAPDQYLIIGARPERAQSLGCQSFVRREEALPLQRLLVIRAYPARATEAPELSFEADEEASTASRATPLALQAAWTAAHLNSP
jgi:hypothetical protein